MEFYVADTLTSRTAVTSDVKGTLYSWLVTHTPSDIGHMIDCLDLALKRRDWKTVKQIANDLDIVVTWTN